MRSTLSTSPRSLFLGALALLASACASPEPEGEGDPEARIRRTDFGVAHIEAGDLRGLGFGEGYAQAQDHLCSLADQVIEARGERARWFGAGEQDEHLHSDIGMKALRVHQGAGDELEQQSDEFRQWYEGYVAGYNRYLEETGRDRVPGWCRGAEWVQPITVQDLAAYHRLVTLVSTRFDSMIATATPPAGADEGDDGAPTAGGAQAAMHTGGSDTGPGIRDLGASNGWAIGGDLSVTGRGMLIANPHYPWVGSNRFWEKHLTIPGELDVYGVGLIGIPGVAIGFNRAVAWTHTVSAGVRYTLYALELVPGQPTRYRYDGEEREMTSRTVDIEVRGENGEVSSQQHTVWFSHHGPIVSFPGVGWTESTVLALRDANELNDEGRAQWLAMGRAGSLEQFQAAHAEHQGMPWVNTIAASADGTAWYVDSSSTPLLSDAALASWQELRQNDPLIAGMAQRGVVVLPGNDPRFEWQTDPEARDPGVVAFAEMPQLARRDYVFNANDSFWMANSSALLEGDYSPLHGEQDTQRSLRTRNNDLTLSGRSPDDPNGEDDKFSLDEMASALLSNRSYTAELLKPELLAACSATPTAQGRGGAVALGEACSVLERWNDRFDTDASGAVLFREWIGQYEPADLDGAGRLFEVPFDPEDPVDTPRGLADEGLALRHLAQAVEVLRSAGHPLDVTLGELQYAPSKLPARLPVHGGHGAYEGVMNMQQGGRNSTTLEPLELGEQVDGSRFLTTEGYPVVHGSSFLMALAYTDEGPRAKAFLTYGQSGDPESEHFRDQTKLFSEKQWRPILFEEEEIAANTTSEKRFGGD